MEDATKRTVIASLALASRLFRDAIRAFKVEARVSLGKLVTREHRDDAYAILRALTNPLSQAEIARLTDCSVPTVARLSLIDPLQVAASEYAVTSGRGRKRKLTEAESKTIEESIGQRGQSTRKLAAGMGVSHVTVWMDLRRRGARPFKFFKVPMLTVLNVATRVAMTNWIFGAWVKADCDRLMCSDEFFVWATRGPNNQNDRIWAHHRSDVRHLLESPQTHSPTCVGIFLLFSMKRMMWVIKPHGQNWNGEYFREIVLKRNVIPFMLNPENRLDDEFRTPVLLHDMAGCFRALATHELLDSFDIDFFRSSPGLGYPRWSGNSPDWNPAENAGAIVMDRVETRLRLEPHPQRRLTLIRVIDAVCREMEYEEELFTSLVRSFWRRSELVRAAHGGAIGEY